MAVNPSRVKGGSLHFGGATPVDYSCNPTSIKLTPSTSTDDAVEVLCGDIISGVGITTWTLDGTAISDFSDPSGFVLYCYTNNGQTVPFTWTPNPTSGTWSGSVVISALEIGGDVNSQLTSDFSFPVTGTLALAPYVP